MELEERIKRFKKFLISHNIIMRKSGDVFEYGGGRRYSQNIVFEINEGKPLLFEVIETSDPAVFDSYDSIIKRICETNLYNKLIPELEKEVEALPSEERDDEYIINEVKSRTIRERTLDEAKICILGDREQDYGSPENNFATIAKFWSSYLDKDISAQQVADMMILMKISRIKNGGGTGDSCVDIAGYAACGNEILNKTRK